MTKKAINLVTVLIFLVIGCSYPTKERVKLHPPILGPIIDGSTLNIDVTSSNLSLGGHYILNVCLMNEGLPQHQMPILTQMQIDDFYAEEETYTYNYEAQIISASGAPLSPNRLYYVKTQLSWLNQWGLPCYTMDDEEFLVRQYEPQNYAEMRQEMVRLSAYYHSFPGNIKPWCIPAPDRLVTELSKNFPEPYQDEGYVYSLEIWSGNNYPQDIPKDQFYIYDAVPYNLTTFHRENWESTWIRLWNNTASPDNYYCYAENPKGVIDEEKCGDPTRAIPGALHYWIEYNNDGYLDNLVGMCCHQLIRQIAYDAGFTEQEIGSDDYFLNGDIVQVVDKDQAQPGDILLFDFHYFDWKKAQWVGIPGAYDHAALVIEVSDPSWMVWHWKVVHTFKYVELFRYSAKETIVKEFAVKGLDPPGGQFSREGKFPPISLNPIYGQVSYKVLRFGDEE